MGGTGRAAAERERDRCGGEGEGKRAREKRRRERSPRFMMVARGMRSDGVLRTGAARGAGVAGTSRLSGGERAPRPVTLRGKLRMGGHSAAQNANNRTRCAQPPLRNVITSDSGPTPLRPSVIDSWQTTAERAGLCEWLLPCLS